MRSPGGWQRALNRITAATNAAQRRAWAAIQAQHGALPGIRIPDKILDGGPIRLDASVVACHSPDKQEGAEPDFMGFGLLAHCWLIATTPPSRWPEKMRIFARRERPTPVPSSPCPRPKTAGATACR